MTTDLATTQPISADIEKVLLGGDLSKLTPEQRLSYYNAVCRSLNLNPLTKPFAYIQLNGKLTLYALKDCTEQLRNQQAISLAITGREVIEGVYVVTARATRPDGRQDEATGAVPIEGLKGEAKANAMMKAETKAKRRVTLSVCGLGMIDESETESIRGARLIDEPTAPPERPIPEELKIAIGKLREKDTKIFAPTAKFVQEEMLTLGLGEEYDHRSAQLRRGFPQTIPFDALETFLLDCWELVEKAKAPA
jgi:hypothetical protein